MPRPRGSDGPVRLVGRLEPVGAVTPWSAARGRSATAVLDAVAPPWLRVPSGASDAPHPAVHRAPVHRPVVLRAVGNPPPPVVDGPLRPVARPPVRPPVLHHPARARPPVDPEPGILGLSRLTRGRVGSRLFTLFFVTVFGVILVQMLVAILHG